LPSFGPALTLPTDDGRTGSQLTQFSEPEKSIGSVSAQIAARLLAVAADITLVIDAQGVICDLSLNSDMPKPDQWIGCKWLDTVTIESRIKVEELLKEAKSGGFSRPRQINHRLPGGLNLPVRYSSVEMGKSGRIVALGQELRSLSQMQQRLVEAQRTTEQEFLRLRSAETRFRILFQMASEAVLVADANTLKTIDANPAAAALLETTTGKLVSRPLADIFDAETRTAIEPQITAIRSIGRIEASSVRLANRRECWLSASLIRQDDSAQLLVRLTPFAETGGTGLPLSKLHMLRAIESMPDAMLLVDQNRCILDANQAFLEMAQIPALSQAKGQSIDRWLGRSGVDLNVLFANLREHGTMRNFATALRSDFGYMEDVEISGVCMQGSESPTHALLVRTMVRQSRGAQVATADSTRHAEQLSELVGRVPLKDLIRETTEITEKLCIEAALKLTGDNRAAAAQMLGLSRQSLYGKLRRYGIGDLDEDPEEADDIS
jgi:transcriptional regulator PpsR